MNWLKKKDASASTGIFKRLKNGLSKTRQILSTDIDQLFAGGKKIDEAMLEELEALLITSDIGVRTTTELIERISIKSNQISDADELKKELKSEIKTFLMANPPPPDNMEDLRVIMVVGVNGVGKTTTIGKIAAKYADREEKVLIVAADTFRAAATEQMMIWAERARADIVVRKAKSDPAAVVYDGLETAVSKKTDIVLIDTAGRLHTKINLMEELKKIKRTISKKLTDAPHEILLVLDATTGQNALSQARLFNDALGITGIALTKLDGTAKGGIVVSICRTLKIPLRYIGIGEKIDDLHDFDPAIFTEALF